MTLLRPASLARGRTPRRPGWPRHATACRRSAHLALDAQRHVLVTTLAGDTALPLLQPTRPARGVERLLARLGGGDQQSASATLRTLRHNPARRWRWRALERDGTRPSSCAPSSARTVHVPRGRAYPLPGPRPSPRPARAPPVALVGCRAGVTWANGTVLDTQSGRARALARRGQAAGRPPRPPAAAPGVRSAACRHPRGRRYSARRGGHEEDLGCLAASVAVLAEDGSGPGSGARDVEAFLAGYEDVRRPPEARAVALHEVGFRLRKAVDPFRECAPDWRERVVARVHAARGGLDELPGRAEQVSGRPDPAGR